MPYRNRTYITFDGDEDMWPYRQMCGWAANSKMSFNFYNSHDLNSARDTSLTESIKNQLKARLDNTKLMIVLIGEKTRGLRKFVPWEIEQAIKRNIPIIAVNLNGFRKNDARCPASLDGQLALFVPFRQKIIEYAMDDWPRDHTSRSSRGETGAHWYYDSVYDRLGL